MAVVKGPTRTRHVIGHRGDLPLFSGLLTSPLLYRVTYQQLLWSFCLPTGSLLRCYRDKDSALRAAKVATARVEPMKTGPTKQRLSLPARAGRLGVLYAECD